MHDPQTQFYIRSTEPNAPNGLETHKVASFMKFNNPKQQDLEKEMEKSIDLIINSSR